jgi:hypothetical protein
MGATLPFDKRVGYRRKDLTNPIHIRAGPTALHGAALLLDFESAWNNQVDFSERMIQKKLLGHLAL